MLLVNCRGGPPSPPPPNQPYGLKTIYHQLTRPSYRCTPFRGRAEEKGGGEDTTNVPASIAQDCPHRRRIHAEEKAKVVASVWGEEFI